MQRRPRYPKMSLLPFGAGFLHKRNPWMAMACSIALPGLGHFYCGSYLTGFVLMSWEILVNMMGRVNLGIFLTVLGYPDRAAQIMDYSWALMYPVFYVLAIWDSYRLAVDINKRCELEERQPVREFKVMTITPWEISFLGKRNPWMAAFLAFFLGGAGHLYNFRILKGAMLMGWHLAIWLNSGLNLALLSTLQGDWQAVHTIVDYQWLLFWPSIHMFNVWDAYADAVAMNKLYEEEIEYFLRQVTGVEPATSQLRGLPMWES